jgi:glycopeptide antibiotics resistance protein
MSSTDLCFLWWKSQQSQIHKTAEGINVENEVTDVCLICLILFPIRMLTTLEKNTEKQHASAGWNGNNIMLSCFFFFLIFSFELAAVPWEKELY